MIVGAYAIGVKGTEAGMVPFVLGFGCLVGSYPKPYLDEGSTPRITIRNPGNQIRRR
jgi:hypothetical protein